MLLSVRSRPVKNSTVSLYPFRIDKAWLVNEISSRVADIPSSRRRAFPDFLPTMLCYSSASSRCEVIPVRETRIQGTSRELRRFADCACRWYLLLGSNETHHQNGCMMSGRLSSGPSTGRKRQKAKMDRNNGRRASVNEPAAFLGSHPKAASLGQAVRARRSAVGPDAVTTRLSWLGSRLTVRSAC